MCRLIESVRGALPLSASRLDSHQGQILSPHAPPLQALSSYACAPVEKGGSQCSTHEQGTITGRCSGLRLRLEREREDAKLSPQMLKYTPSTGLELGYFLIASTAQLLKHHWPESRAYLAVVHLGKVHLWCSFCMHFKENFCQLMLWIIQEPSNLVGTL